MTATGVTTDVEQEASEASKGTGNMSEKVETSTKNSAFTSAMLGITNAVTSRLPNHGCTLIGRDNSLEPNPHVGASIPPSSKVKTAAIGLKQLLENMLCVEKGLAYCGRAYSEHPQERSKFSPLEEKLLEHRESQIERMKHYLLDFPPATATDFERSIHHLRLKYYVMWLGCHAEARAEQFLQQELQRADIGSSYAQDLQDIVVQRRDFQSWGERVLGSCNKLFERFEAIIQPAPSAAGIATTTCEREDSAKAAEDKRDAAAEFYFTVKVGFWLHDRSAQSYYEEACEAVLTMTATIEGKDMGAVGNEAKTAAAAIFAGANGHGRASKVSGLAGPTMAATSTPQPPRVFPCNVGRSDTNPSAAMTATGPTSVPIDVEAEATETSNGNGSGGKTVEDPTKNIALPTAVAALTGGKIGAQAFSPFPKEDKLDENAEGRPAENEGTIVGCESEQSSPVGRVNASNALVKTAVALQKMLPSVVAVAKGLAVSKMGGLSYREQRSEFERHHLKWREREEANKENVSRLLQDLPDFIAAELESSLNLLATTLWNAWCCTYSKDLREAVLETRRDLPTFESYWLTVVAKQHKELTDRLAAIIDPASSAVGMSTATCEGEKSDKAAVDFIAHLGDGWERRDWSASDLLEACCSDNVSWNEDGEGRDSDAARNEDEAEDDDA
jgi:hypothetical protein